MADISYIIVQAGGKGTRMKKYTRNKPKALVPVENLPMLFHLFRAYPDKKFIIVGDYKYDVLEKYLQAFCTVDYTLVRGTGYVGTCAGLSSALKFIPDNKAFVLIWSDLVLPKGFALPEGCGNYLGISKDFRCRWSYIDEKLVEIPSETQGVAGFFTFQQKAVLDGLPLGGEFVRYLQENNIQFNEVPLFGTHEYGLIEEYVKLPRFRCRPFNKITIKGETLIKEGIDEQGKALAVRERAWYQKVTTENFLNIPAVYSYNPLEMECIQGKNIYECNDLDYKSKRKILERLIDCLEKLHALESVPSDIASYSDAYIEKTMKRLDKVRQLVPFANDPVVVVNQRTCRNIFYHWDEVRAKIMSYMPKSFQLIHGDCTFSNMLLREADLSPVLIDPRGYFGYTEFLGDVAYEWAKLYYSIVGNYDRFNLKKFDLSINERDVELSIESNGWEDMEDDFFALVEKDVSREQIRLIHAIIWLSLTTYSWEDYDSICGAFYNGLYYLEEALS